MARGLTHTQTHGHRSQEDFFCVDKQSETTSQENDSFVRVSNLI